MDNIVFITFKQQEPLDAVVERFRERPVTDEYSVLQAAVLRRLSGEIVPEQDIRFTGDDTGHLTYDLIDSVVRVVAGPIGRIIGGYAGALLDADLNANRIVEESGILEAIAAKLNDNEWALLALVREHSEISLSSRLNSLGASAAVRKDAALVAYEVMNADEILAGWEEKLGPLHAVTPNDSIREKVRAELRERANRDSFEQEESVRERLRGDFEYLHSRVKGWQGRNQAPSVD
ncbi:hypothetical protein QWJ34_18000 [Saccharibacillus sp. CPCC 101409]|uniref:hypothetical protein n=1 Tax=Saccharibacillus sp. CPCC 101409 TaxID=3058041 RepID=UPI002672C8D4|nr:hypothetical protein [Saccharibacillus sp. CPCC 101409]MDO3411661.1 hypothetical protein [Saccharibacillus sp. CPCC 101409]